MKDLSVRVWVYGRKSSFRVATSKVSVIHTKSLGVFVSCTNLMLPALAN